MDDFATSPIQPRSNTTSRRGPSDGLRARLRSVPEIDFTKPAGEPALAAPDSVSWQIFKNPVSLYIGGVAAVILELAEPTVRTGVWEHTRFRIDPIPRMLRTGMAAMVTVYGARSVAEERIAGVVRMHDRVSGKTPAGVAYHANDVELLDWVQATAIYGFGQAYSEYVRRLGQDEFERLYAEGVPGARLFGAITAPSSVAEQEALFETMKDRLERHPIVFEFLDIMSKIRTLPRPLWPLQNMLVRASIAILPAWVRERLGLGPQWDLKGWEKHLIRATGRLMDAIPVPGSPPYQAARRLGLPGTYVWKRARPSEGASHRRTGRVS